MPVRATKKFNDRIEFIQYIIYSLCMQNVGAEVKIGESDYMIKERKYGEYRHCLYFLIKDEKITMLKREKVLAHLTV